VVAPVAATAADDKTVLLIYAEDDQGVPIAQGRALAKRIEELGKDVQLAVYPGVGHAFFNNTGGNYNASAAADAWKRTLDFFRANVT